MNIVTAVTTYMVTASWRAGGKNSLPFDRSSHGSRVSPVADCLTKHPSNCGGQRKDVVFDWRRQLQHLRSGVAIDGHELFGHSPTGPPKCESVSSATVTVPIVKMII